MFRIIYRTLRRPILFSILQDFSVNRYSFSIQQRVCEPDQPGTFVSQIERKEKNPQSRVKFHDCFN